MVFSPELGAADLKLAGLASFQVLDGVLVIPAQCARNVLHKGTQDGRPPQQIPQTKLCLCRAAQTLPCAYAVCGLGML